MPSSRAPRRIAACRCAALVLLIAACAAQHEQPSHSDEDRTEAARADSRESSAETRAATAYRETGAFSSRGFVPPIDLLQLSIQEGSPYPSLVDHEAPTDIRIWWVEDMGIENGLLLLWNDDSGHANARYFVWRFLYHPDAQAPSRTQSPARCSRQLQSDLLAVCEIEVRAGESASKTVALVEDLLATNPAGDGDRMILHPDDLFIEVSDIGRTTTLRYDGRSSDSPEHRIAGSIRDAVLELHERAAKTLPGRTIK